MLQKVYIIDDDEVVCEVIEQILMTVGLKTQSYLSAVEFLKDFNPEMHGCVVSDINMAEINGLELQRQLRKLGSRMPLIFITGFADVEIAVTVLKAGAFDFIEKPFRDQSLIETINSALEQDLSDSHAVELGAETERRVNKLTKRESRVFELLLQGGTSKDIGNILGISPRTVDVHRQHILGKFEINSVAELIHYCATRSAS